MRTQARLNARPAATMTGTGEPGQKSLPLGAGPEVALYVPVQYDVRRPAPLALLLHGAGGHATDGVNILRHLADAAGIILLAPSSHARTWDLISHRSFGLDLALIDRALDHVFNRYAIRPDRLAIGGFSDGASYGLTLGINNGDLFSHILAFSPGFMAPNSMVGAPALFISHGTEDRVLPVGACSRTVVDSLRRLGYRLHYEEFTAGHVIPPDVARQAVDWFLSSEPDPV